MTDPVPRDAEVAVTLVLAKRLTDGRQVGPELVAPNVEERPNRVSGSRMNPAEPARSRASDHPQEKGLGLIVPRVPGRNGVGLELGRDAREELIARPAASILERDPQRVRL